LTKRLPADLASSQAQTLGFLRDEVDAADKVTAALLGDVRFEHLDHASVMEFPGVRLLPVDDPQVPSPASGFVLERPTGCVAAMEVEGSSFARMADRARDRVNDLLRAMRIAQSARVRGFQLRFRLGIGYAFDDRLHGWNRRDDEAFELTLTRQGVEELLSHPAMSVPVSERSDVEEKAALAMGWMERPA
jgi:hypothetical protein